MRPLNLSLLFICCLSSYSSHAQKFSLGAKAGVLFTYANFSKDADHANTISLIKPGFSLAGIIDFPMKKKYSYQVEAGVSQQGRLVSYTNIGTHRNNSTYYFADLAMGLRKTFSMKIKNNVATNWFVNFGPNINYWIGGKGHIDTDGGIRQNYTMIFDKSSGGGYNKMFVVNENRWLFGLNLGFGFNGVTRKNQKVITEFRLTWGQTYLGPNQSAQMNLPAFQGQETMKFNLKVLNVSVGYIFDKDLRKAKEGKSDLQKRLK